RAGGGAEARSWRMTTSAQPLLHFGQRALLLRGELAPAPGAVVVGADAAQGEEAIEVRERVEARAEVGRELARGIGELGVERIVLPALDRVRERGAFARSLLLAPDLRGHVRAGAGLGAPLAHGRAGLARGAILFFEPARELPR